MNKENIVAKIQALRQVMLSENVQACIIPSSDPHIDEYTPDCWKTREWISGFTGSAGTVVVTLDKIGLWTDSRYFLQAESQLNGTEIVLHKTGLPETQEIPEWIASELSVGDCVGIEGAVFTLSEARSLIDFFSGKKLQVRTDFAPYNTLWKDRPLIPVHSAFILPDSFAGKSSREKRAEVLELMRKNDTNLTILVSLDMIAWLFNIRGNDVKYNPVVVSYAIVSEEETVLFIQPEKLTGDVKEYLREQGVSIACYDEITNYVASRHEAKILITPAKINYALYSTIPADCKITELTVHPVDTLKGIKNETEIACIKDAMRKDGVALVQFFYDLEKTLAAGEKTSELTVAEKIRLFRSLQKWFVSESFETIAGYGPHGAIVHYSATPDSDSEIEQNNLLLIDSGAQYLNGTTDITRTLAIGEVSSEVKKDYTNVLKGHIALASARFPKGTTGMQLDILARQFLWKSGQNFQHGTGHGVGFFLNVHEGPQSIRMNFNPATLEPGMLTSNEPGLYRTGKYGIRIENLLLTTHDQSTEFGDFYRFDTLSLCPISTNIIDKSLLDKEEKDWLNSYHRKVYETLSPFLSEEENDWLKRQTDEI
ncbi:aminopeptidase [Bacteroidia bacterium]|nr:aminopeptidase [Bacteroidia bacterium]